MYGMDLQDNDSYWNYSIQFSCTVPWKYITILVYFYFWFISNIRFISSNFDSVRNLPLLSVAAGVFCQTDGEKFMFNHFFRAILLSWKRNPGPKMTHNDFPTNACIPFHSRHRQLRLETRSRCILIYKDCLYSTDRRLFQSDPSRSDNLIGIRSRAARGPQRVQRGQGGLHGAWMMGCEADYTLTRPRSSESL